MPTVVTKTVKPSGGDYTTLRAAIIGEAADLVSNDTQIDIACYAMQDTTAVAVADWAGYTTDATHYVRIYTPSTERHNGKRSTSKYRLEAAKPFTDGALSLSAQYVHIDGLQIKNTHGGAHAALSITGSTTFQITDTLIYDTHGGGQGGWGISVSANNSVVYLNNVQVMSCDAGIEAHANGAPVIYALNCSAVNSTVGPGFTAVGFTRFIYAKNCYSGGNAGDDYSGAGVTIDATCYSEDGTASTPTAAWSTANFTNVTAGSEDLSLVSGSALIDVGTDVSADSNWIEPGGNVDIIGTARPQGSAWDVGAFERITIATLNSGFLAFM